MKKITSMSEYNKIIPKGVFSKRQFVNQSYDEANRLILMVVKSVSEPTLEITIKKHDRTVDVIFTKNNFSLPSFHSYPISLITECMKLLKADTCIDIKVGTDGIFYKADEEAIDVMEKALARQTREYFHQPR